jgi:hypothetical protein
MAAILVSFGFTFLIDRMTEVLTPDIYIELTDAGSIPARGPIFQFQLLLAYTCAMVYVQVNV